MHFHVQNIKLKVLGMNKSPGPTQVGWGLMNPQFQDNEIWRLTNLMVQYMRI